MKDNRIEEVKKMHGLDTIKEAEVWAILLNVGFNWGLNHLRRVVKEIFQLFPQPLGGKELKAKIDEALISLVSSTRLPAECPEVLLLPEIFRASSYIYSALLRPKIEEARKEGFDDGVSKTTIAMDSTINAQLGEAIKQERERIKGELSEFVSMLKSAPEMHGDIQSDIPKTYNFIRWWQALSGKGAGK